MASLVSVSPLRDSADGLVGWISAVEEYRPLLAAENIGDLNLSWRVLIKQFTAALQRKDGDIGGGGRAYPSQPAWAPSESAGIKRVNPS